MKQFTAAAAARFIRLISHPEPNFMLSDFAARECIVSSLQQHRRMWYSKIPCSNSHLRSILARLSLSSVHSSPAFLCQDRNDLFYLQLKIFEKRLYAYEQAGWRQAARVSDSTSVHIWNCVWPARDSDRLHVLVFEQVEGALYPISSSHAIAFALVINKHKQPSCVRISHV